MGYSRNVFLEAEYMNKSTIESYCNCAVGASQFSRSYCSAVTLTS